MELPPRARRILLRFSPLAAVRGTTSACAENTAPIIQCGLPRRNYLRVRGEYLDIILPGWREVELPPRARRILKVLLPNGFGVGTTSACAENTPCPSSTATPSRNYLRVRGEYLRVQQFCCKLQELPPRARRIPNHLRKVGKELGTTSACAENTRDGGQPTRQYRNYLRVRGEYFNRHKLRLC